jgi:hypothetical protein
LRVVGYTLDTNIIRPVLKNDEDVFARISDATHRGLVVSLNAVAYFETRRGLLAAGATGLEIEDWLAPELDGGPGSSPR